MNQLDDQVDSCKTSLMKYLTEAYEIRKTLTSDSYSSSLDDPETLYDQLKYARHVVDRLEHILVQVSLTTAKVDTMKSRTAADVEDAEVEQYDNRSTNDFVSGRERSVELNLKTIKQRREHRKTTTLAIEAHAVIDSVRTMHRGADSYRREVDTRLRAITLRTALDK